MEIRTEITQSDVLEFAKVVQKNTPRPVPLYAAALVFGYLLSLLDVPVHLPTAFGTFAYVVIVTNLLNTLRMRKLMSKGSSPRFGPKTFMLLPEGMSEAGDGYESRASWSVLKSIQETDQHLFLFIDQAMAYIIPKRSFPDARELEQFKTQLGQYLKHAQT